jgi:hypothetical protein
VSACCAERSADAEKTGLPYPRRDVRLADSLRQARNRASLLPHFLWISSPRTLICISPSSSQSPRSSTLSSFFTIFPLPRCGS